MWTEIQNITIYTKSETCHGTHTGELQLVDDVHENTLLITVYISFKMLVKVQFVHDTPVSLSN